MSNLIGKTSRGEYVWSYHTPQSCLNYIKAYNNLIGYWLRTIRLYGKSKNRLEVLKECILQRNRFRRILSVVLQHEPE